MTKRLSNLITLQPSDELSVKLRTGQIYDKMKSKTLICLCGSAMVYDNEIYGVSAKCTNPECPFSMRWYSPSHYLQVSDLYSTIMEIEIVVTYTSNADNKGDER